MQPRSTCAGSFLQLSIGRTMVSTRNPCRDGPIPLQNSALHPVSSIAAGSVEFMQVHCTGTCSITDIGVNSRPVALIGHRAVPNSVCLWLLHACFCNISVSCQLIQQAVRHGADNCFCIADVLIRGCTERTPMQCSCP